jgi:hypothetical protein
MEPIVSSERGGLRSHLNSAQGYFFFLTPTIPSANMSLEKHDSNEKGGDVAHDEEIDLLSFHEQRAGRLVIDPE